MKVSINIKIRNPEWYWTKEELEISKQKGQMSREEWEALMSDKIPKHSEFVDFEYAFEVIKHTDNRNSNYPLTIYSEDPATQELIPHDVILENMTVVEFIGDNKKSSIAISNELIHQYFGARQKQGRLYWYFYLKENLPCISFSRKVWISETQLKHFGFEAYGIDKDENLIIREFGGLREANIDYCD